MTSLNKLIALALLLLPVFAFSQTQYSEIVKGSSTQTDTLLTFTGTGADTSIAYVLCPNSSFRPDVTTSNDSTNLVVYPIFSDTPHEGYKRRTPAREPDSATDFTNTVGSVDSSSWLTIDDNNVQACQPISLDGPALFVKFVAAGFTGNELSTATSVKVTLTQDCGR